jgi:hypothetical protein
MNKKDRMRSIKLEGDVASIAEELASKRILSKTLSELLRKEYGISFEDDLLKSRMNDLKRQSEQIEEQLSELTHTMNRKESQKFNDQQIANLETELNNFDILQRKELQMVIDMTYLELGIDKTKYEPHQLMSEISKAKGLIRIEIHSKFAKRKKEILKELEMRYDERENYE